VTTNGAINDIARMGRSFRPLEGWVASDPGGAETMYVLVTDEATWLAVFNFDAQVASSGSVELERLGLTGGGIVCDELWTSTDVSVSRGELRFSVPPQDVRVYKLTKQL
jgi:alpha-galactosidase